jgi:hypothetical protein
MRGDPECTPASRHWTYVATLVLLARLVGENPSRIGHDEQRDRQGDGLGLGLGRQGDGEGLINVLPRQGDGEDRCGRISAPVVDHLQSTCW